jgi:hypothetical protein
MVNSIILSQISNLYSNLQERMEAMRAIAHSHAQKSMLDEAMEKQYAQDYQVDALHCVPR